MWSSHKIPRLNYGIKTSLMRQLPDQWITSHLALFSLIVIAGVYLWLIENAEARPPPDEDNPPYYRTSDPKHTSVKCAITSQVSGRRQPVECENKAPKAYTKFKWPCPYEDNLHDYQTAPSIIIRWKWVPETPLEPSDAPQGVSYSPEVPPPIGRAQGVFIIWV